MKKLLIIVMVCCLVCPDSIKAQSDEAQQLLLNVEKLAQLKKILSNMYDGYAIVSKGYNTIKDISQGNFNLHQVFLNGLFQVSVTVRKYKKIRDIINYQAQLSREYRSVMQRFTSSNLFSEKEVKYLSAVYENLFDKSLQHLEELTLVITAGKLRMSDDERIKSIDRLSNQMLDQLVFIKKFNTENNLMIIERNKEMRDVDLSRRLIGL